MDQDLHRFEEWFGRILRGLEPGERVRASQRLAQELRRLNLKRIAANVDPDGAAMERRRPRLERGGQLRKRANGRMFKGLRAFRNWRISADADGAEIRPVHGLVERVATINHFGETATVGRARDGRLIRHRYAERRLLGFGAEGEALVNDAASDLIERNLR